MRVVPLVWCVLATSAWSQVDAGLEEDAGVPAVVESPRPVPVLVPQPAPVPEPEPPKPLDLSFLSVLLPITPALSSLYYDFSAVYSHQGYGFPEGPMRLTGLHFVERNSGLGKMTVYVVTQLLLAMGEAAASSGLVQKHLGTELGATHVSIVGTACWRPKFD